MTPIRPRWNATGEVVKSPSPDDVRLLPMDFFKRWRTARAPASARVSTGLLTTDPDDERLLNALLDDISVSAKEMKLLVAMPDASIADIRKLAARNDRC